MNNYTKTSDFYYSLPESLIAQSPVSPRDSSRLLIYDAKTGETHHAKFFNLLDYLQPNDVLVINNTKVIPARIYGYDESQRKFEILLLKRIDNYQWECLIRPAKKIKIGKRLFINNELSLDLIKILDDNGIRIISFNYSGRFENILEKVGCTPLPPYIKTKLDNPENYQTVYAKYDGSSAAPTAGLHFTQNLLNSIKEKGVKIAEVLLHVGLGTFRPVKEQNITDHQMHKEYYSVSNNTAQIINEAIDRHYRIIAVGTTSVRTLETIAAPDGHVVPGEGETDIFIYPSYQFKIVDAIITNFHLPESTLLMLVSAFIGRDKTLELYNEAVDMNYRFFSFGDAMFLTGGKNV